MDFKKVLGKATKEDAVIDVEIQTVENLGKTIALFEKYSQYMKETDAEDLATTKCVMNNFQSMMISEVEKYRGK